MYPNIAILCAGDGRACLTSHRTYGSYIIPGTGIYMLYLSVVACLVQTVPGTYGYNNYYTAVTIVTIDSFGLVGVLTRRTFQLF